ncbi:MAG: hypothetical protein KBE91_04085 [Bacteroidia bacterium]|nr:hypothetical protein [Bacteroidia bacterium]MBP9688766.1 hypothetical protein [Bacteroidia bacterium]
MFGKHRILENLHIPLWLLKDTCWLLSFKFIGTLISIPTLLIALTLVVISIKFPKRFWPNLAVFFWISANSTWMIGEFYQLNFVTPALVLFALGLMSSLVYVYMIFFIKKPNT